MYRLLTLAISEMKKNNFKVIVYDLDNQRFCGLQIHERDFNYEGEVPSWDLFGVTELENLTPPNRGEFYTPIGKATVKEYYRKKEIVNFFKRRKISYKRFLNSNERYGIIKIDMIEKIDMPKRRENNGLYQRVSLITAGQRQRPILNKDYRWLNYWDNISEDNWQDKLTKWKNYINKRDKEVFAVVNNHTFPDGSKNKWIAGFHCL